MAPNEKPILPNLVSSWARNEPEAAGKWLTSLPEDKTKENAVRKYVNYLSWQYPEYAPFAASITDEQQRNNSIENVARNWLRTDPTKAAAWMATTQLPIDCQNKLLKSVKQ